VDRPVFPVSAMTSPGRTRAPRRALIADRCRNFATVPSSKRISRQLPLPRSFQLIRLMVPARGAFTSVPTAALKSMPRWVGRSFSSAVICS
jgi:hypothetical protein